MKSGKNGPMDRGAKKELDVSNVRLPSEANVNAYISVRTGEEFSSEFLRDRLTPKLSQNRNVKTEFTDDKDPQMGYDDFARIFGIQNMESECRSEAFDLTSTRGLPLEDDLRRAPINGTRRCQNTSDDSIYHMSREANDEAGFGGAKSRPRVSPISIPQSPYTFITHEQGFPDMSQPGKMRILCSFGGKILPRPGDGKLRYVGGETRIISIRKNISWGELLIKTSSICNQAHTIKYQLPGEDLDSLISVSSDEDLQNMMEEYHGVEKSSGSQRLRILLIPSSENENHSSSLESCSSSIAQSSPDYEYVVAVNGIIDPSPRKTSGDLLMANEIRKPNIKLEPTPSFVQNSPSPKQMEPKDCPRISHQIQIPSDSPFFNKSPVQSPSFSPRPVQLTDSKSVVMQLYDDKLQKESISCQQIYDSSFVKPTLQGRKFQFQAPQTNQECSAPPVASCSTLLQVDSHPLDQRAAENEIPLLKRRTSQDGDQGIMLASSNLIGSQLGMCHAFSDSQLQEHDQRPSCCSQEEINDPSCSLSFQKVTSPLSVSAPSQEKQVQQQENAYAAVTQRKMLNFESQSSKIDIPGGPLCSTPLSPFMQSIERKSNVLERSQTTGDLDEAQLMKTDLNESDSFSVRVMNNEFNGSISQLSQSMIVESRLSSITAKCNLQNENAYPQLFVASNADTSDSELPKVDLTKNQHPYHSRNILNEQNCRTSKHGRNQQWDVGPIALARLPSEPVPSYCQNSQTDLLSGLLDDHLDIHAFEGLLPVTYHRDGVTRGSLLISTTDIFSPLTCPGPTVGSLVEKSNGKNSQKLDVGEQNHLEPLLVIEDVTDCMFTGVGSSASFTSHALDLASFQLPSPSVTVEEDASPAGVHSEVGSGERQKDELMDDAVIAEIEAGIYGLQGCDTSCTLNLVSAAAIYH